MNISDLFPIIAIYPIVKEIHKDIKNASKQKEKWELRHSLWQQNRKYIFAGIILFIFFFLLFTESLTYTVSFFLSHKIMGTILFSIITTFFLYYIIILILSTIMITISILRATYQLNKARKEEAQRKEEYSSQTATKVA